MKLILTDDVMDVSPGVLLFTKERLTEILEFINNGNELDRADELRNEAVDAGQKSPDCLSTQHSWKKEYYGYKCERCQIFIPFGSEPWAPIDE